jgi:hypothetical protein
MTNIDLLLPKGDLSVPTDNNSTRNLLTTAVSMPSFAKPLGEVRVKLKYTVMERESEGKKEMGRKEWQKEWEERKWRWTTDRKRGRKGRRGEDNLLFLCLPLQTL